MTRAERSSFFFGIYVTSGGVVLVLIPNVLLFIFSIPTTSEIWIRVLGAALVPVGLYYIEGLAPEPRGSSAYRFGDAGLSHSACSSSSGWGWSTGPWFFSGSSISAPRRGRRSSCAERACPCHQPQRYAPDLVSARASASRGESKASATGCRFETKLTPPVGR